MEIDNDTTDFNNDNFEQQYESESDENGGEAFSHDLDSSDTDAEDECDLAEEIQEHEFIYNGSRLTVKEFNLSYLWLCQRLSLPKNKRAQLLAYIKTLLPYPNKITSYHSLVHKISINNEKSVIKACSACFTETKKQPCDTCASSRTIQVAKFNVYNQVERIIQRHWNEIVAYKGIASFIKTNYNSNMYES